MVKLSFGLFGRFKSETGNWKPMFWTLGRTVIIAILTIFLCLVSYAQKVQLGANPPWQKGNPNAEFKIEVFNDYQCGACVNYNKLLNRVEKKYRGNVLIIFRNFPLTIPAHANALSAAKAVEAAGIQGRFTGMLNLLYRYQSVWSNQGKTSKTFVKYAKKLKINISMFKLDFESASVMNRINSDIERARSLKLNSTPSVFLNGKELTFSDAQDLDAIISKGN